MTETNYIEGPRPLLETWQGERDAMPYNAVSVPAGTMVREITGGDGEAWVYLLAEIDGVEVSLRGRSDPVLRDPSREPREWRCGPACDARYHEVRTILGAGKTETITDAARRVVATLDEATAETGTKPNTESEHQRLRTKLKAARAAETEAKRSHGAARESFYRSAFEIAEQADKARLDLRRALRRLAETRQLLDVMADALSRGEQNWPTSSGAVLTEARTRLALRDENGGAR